jgi:VCBS repeat-containing protein
MLSGNSSTIKPRRSYFNHGQIISGDTNGSLSFTTFKYLIDHINNAYGRSGSDRIRVAGQQEVYEYMASKQLTNVSNIISGNQMTVTLDIANVYNDLRRKALTLLITGKNSTIQSIQYQSGAFSFHSENTNNGLINIER